MRVAASVAAVIVLASMALSGQTPAPPAGRAVITGRVVDEHGDPVIGTPVFIEVKAAAGSTRNVGVGQTDDRGEYRIWRLPAGEYLVSVRPVDAVEVRPSGAIVGGGQRSLSKIYYPVSADAGGAEALRLAADEERERIDFVIPALPPSLPPVALLAQQSGPPAPAPAGTVVLRGRVIALDGRGVPRAHLRMAPIDNVARAQVAVADVEGRFEFRQLAPGRVRVQASKPGYDGIVPGRIVEIVAEKRPEDVELTLVRWAVISGQVVDDVGAPVVNANVAALQVRYDGGRRRLVPADTGRRTDDQGRYRLFGLRAGRYVINAMASGAGSSSTPGFAPSYFPGTTNPASASFVSLGAAQDLSGIDIEMARGTTVRVSGKVVNSAGETTSPGSLTLVSSVRSSLPVSVSLGARLPGDGTFEFPNVPPGQYVIRADRGRQQTETEGEFGTLAISVGDRDVADLVVLTSAGSFVSGRIVFDGRDTSSLPRASAFELRPLPVDFDAAPGTVATATIRDDWTFQMSGLNGPRRLQMTRLPQGWALRDISVRGIDVTDRPLAFGTRDQSLAEVEITLTDHISELAGTVFRDSTRTVPDAAVFVFPTDRDRWYPDSRFIRRTTARADASFSVAGLPFGSYYVASVERLPFVGGSDWQDPEFLESLVPRAATVTLAEGRKETLRVQLQR